MAKVKKTEIPPKDKFTFSTIKQNIIEQLKLGESYVSLILGAVVVSVIFFVFFFFLIGNFKKSLVNSPKQTPTPSKIVANQKIYILQEGESLWDIAVKFYGDGFRYTEITEANKLENPDYIEPGTRLIIPNAK